MKMMKKINSYNKFFFLTSTSCKKLVEVDSPSTSISSKSAFNNDATAVGSISSLYANLWSGFLFGATELIESLSYCWFIG